MRSKAPLVFMEIALMLLVVAMAAGLCLQVFAWAEETSQLEADRAAALLHAQNVAEVLKASHGALTQGIQCLGGSLEGACWVLEQGDFTVRVTPQITPNPYMGSATVETARNGQVLATLTVCWQEVAHGT